jgi:flagellar M-ring protein FliF
MDQSETDSAIHRWLDNLKQYKPYFKYAFLSLFLCLTFLFIVKPLIKWLTGNAAGGTELLDQLPKTVGELENEADPKLLAFKDQISQLITQDSEASLGVMRDWLKEKESADGVQSTQN